jgi:hypothetical protein
MAQRLELQALLETLLGSRNVYFQPPPSVEMKYPCIVYKRDRVNTIYANNLPYRNKTRYQVTVMDRDPDSVIHKRIGQLPLSSYDRFYTADNLNHDVYNLFF